MTTTTTSDFGPMPPASLDGEPAKGGKAALLDEAAALREAARKGSEAERAAFEGVAQALADYGNAYPTPDDLDARVDNMARVMRNAYPLADEAELQRHVGAALAQERAALVDKAEAAKVSVEAALALAEEARTPGDPEPDFAARTYYQQQLRQRFAGKDAGQIAAGLRAMTDDLGIGDPLVREAASRDGRAVLESLGAEDVMTHVRARASELERRLAQRAFLATVGAAHDAKHAYRGDPTTRAGAALRAVGVGANVQPDISATSTSAGGAVKWIEA